tara:strand:- start:3314 stop:3793 length:480 start_codon:yes stop_codon:yes gene_type:complete
MSEIFGGHSMTKESYELILDLLPSGSIMVELGSGRLTNLFATHYQMYSVENDIRWVGVSDSIYIYSPLVDDGWYDPEVLKAALPLVYDFLLVDGPRTQERRAHFIHNMDLFRDDVIWLFDDINQIGNKETFYKVVELTGRDHKVVTCGSKINGILYPAK